MPVIPVPARFAEQFRQLAALDEETFEKLAGGVEAAAPSLGPHRLWHAVADNSGLDFEMVDAMLEGVLSAAAIGSRDGLGPEATARALRIDGLETPRVALDARISRLLSSRAISITVKALDLAVSDEKVLLRPRIVTDVRPIFPVAEGAGGRPDAVLVKHALRLEYLEGNDSRTFVVSLDSVDVTRLREALDRAEQKARSLSAVVEAAGIQELRVEPEDVE